MRLFSHHDRLFITGGEKHHAETLPGSIFVPHFHKIFGLLALLNVIMYITPLHQAAVDYLGKERLMMLSVAHVILAFSSFEFRVPRQRNGLYTIYKEMQLHTIVFTMRSWSVMVGAWVFGIENIVYRMAYVLAWHVAADLATKYYPTPTGETTIRRAVNGEKGYKEHGRLTHMALWIFSFSQLVGTFMMMVDTPNAVRNAMFVMTPVQVSAFLATLVRKGYFRSETSFVVYLLILFPIFYYHPWCPLEVLFVTAVAICRFKLRMNKYVMWITVGLLFAWLAGDLEMATGLRALAPPLLPAFAWQRAQIASGAGQLVEMILGVKLGVRVPARDFDRLYSTFTPESF
jgi:hypothetical protein